MTAVATAAVIAASLGLAVVGRMVQAGAATGGPSRDATQSTGATCRASSFALEPLAHARRQAEAMVARMKLPEELDLMDGVGDGTAPSGTVGSTTPVPSLGIPSLNQQDGPGGVGDGVSGVTQLPAPEDLAATFDPTAAACYGQVIGAEARGKGANLVYGPTVNIVRVPQWGRAFESLGEDPYLTGTLASAEVTGIQRTGTMAQVKHYAVYNQETGRNTNSDDSIVDEKTLQEIYLRAWDTIVAAGPASVMCSYATINGTPACQDAGLIAEHLDSALHFPGFVGSDYYATRSTAASVDAGLDQEQPVPSHFGSSLAAAVADGQVARSTVNEAAVRILTEMYRFRLFTDDSRGSIKSDVATSADARIGNQVAVEGTTLLKNGGHLLPLPAAGRGGIAVIGPGAEAAPVTVGGGSATVTAGSVVTPLAGIRDLAGTGRPVTYVPGLPVLSDFTPIPSADLHVEARSGTFGDTVSATLTVPETGTYELAYREPPDFVPATLSIDGTPVVDNPATPPLATYTGTVDLVAGRTYTLTGPVTQLSWVTPDQISQDLDQAVASARTASAAVIVVGDGQESEAADRLTLDLPGDQNQLVTAVAGVNKHTVVVIDAGGPVVMPWLSDVSSVLDTWYPGQSDGTALAAVLFGRDDPSGHLPVTFPNNTAKDPVATPQQFPGTDNEVHYSEGVDVGYRWYDATGTAPLFPFGFGLSYTTFRYGGASIDEAANHGQPVVTAKVRVENTGHTPGADVAQLYLGQPSAAGNPPRQLAAFQRVSLGPGGSRTVTFTLRGLQLAFYDTAAGSWRIAAGRYTVWLGDSSALAQLPVRLSFRIDRPAGTSP